MRTRCNSTSYYQKFERYNALILNILNTANLVFLFFFFKVRNVYFDHIKCTLHKISFYWYNVCLSKISKKKQKNKKKIQKNVIYPSYTKHTASETKKQKRVSHMAIYVINNKII